MANSYSKVFTNPYPNGWKNLPSTDTPIIAQALQQHTNAIINIENFLYNNPIPTRTSDLVNDSIVLPTKLSDLLNDVGYVTDAAIPTRLSELYNNVGYITSADIPTNLSDFVNDVNFITASVNNLLNYFTKNETYSREEIAQLLQTIRNWDIRIVDELPTTDISETTIYCIRKDSGNIQLAEDYELDLSNNVVNQQVDTMNLGDPVIMAEYVEDPYDGSV